MAARSGGSAARSIARPRRLVEKCGATAAENAEMVRRLLDGEIGPRRDIVLFNAAAALLIAGRVASLREGVRVAAESIDTGGARQALARLCEVCGK